MVRALDRVAHDSGVTRSEAIRRLVEQALAAQPKKAAKR
jgi:metal-responsive CopG/Arc/MetJ family transcriptional regulator